MPVVKLVGRVKLKDVPQIWSRQIPGDGATVGPCRFIFDVDATEYDWLVVYDDLPPLGGERPSKREEKLACPPQNTILITSEPSSIRRYSSAYTRQFGYVVTSQEPRYLRHPGLIHTQSGYRWFYGLGSKTIRGVNEMIAHPPLEKDRLIATVASTKRQRHTVHARRFAFTKALVEAMPEIDRYGHGVIDMDDKAMALDRYRYHVAVENHIAPNHFTEKLADAFLGCTLPFYYGAPNAADYFPPESFIPIDIDDVPGTVEKIRQAIAEDAYSKRLPAILEARRLVIERYGLHPMLAGIIASPPPRPPVAPRASIKSARRARNSAPLIAIVDMAISVLRRR